MKKENKQRKQKIKDAKKKKKKTFKAEIGPKADIMVKNPQYC